MLIHIYASKNGIWYPIDQQEIEKLKGLIDNIPEDNVSEYVKYMEQNVRLRLHGKKVSINSNMIVGELNALIKRNELKLEEPKDISLYYSRVEEKDKKLIIKDSELYQDIIEGNIDPKVDILLITDNDDVRIDSTIALMLIEKGQLVSNKVKEVN